MLHATEGSKVQDEGRKRQEICHGRIRSFRLRKIHFLTHAKHKDKYDVTVLHDDAVVINVKEKYAIALEPAYFDKMQDYPMGCEDNKYLPSFRTAVL